MAPDKQDENRGNSLPVATAALWPSAIAGLFQVKDAEPHFSRHDVTLISSFAT